MAFENCFPLYNHGDISISRGKGFRRYSERAETTPGYYPLPLQNKAASEEFSQYSKRRYDKTKDLPHHMGSSETYKNKLLVVAYNWLQGGRRVKPHLQPKLRRPDMSVDWALQKSATPKTRRHLKVHARGNRGYSTAGRDSLAVKFIPSRKGISSRTYLGVFVAPQGSKRSGVGAEG